MQKGDIPLRSKLLRGMLLLLMCNLVSICCMGLDLLIVDGGAFTRDIAIRASFRLPPDSQLLSNASFYICCDSSRKEFYYWSSHTISAVETFYENYTLPFINHRTFYHPFGGVLKLGFVPYPPAPEEEIDLQVDRECHFSQKFSCVQIQLVDFENADLITLPVPEDFPSVTPQPLPNTLFGGTLIIYSYHVEADFNLLP